MDGKAVTVFIAKYVIVVLVHLVCYRWSSSICIPRSRNQRSFELSRTASVTQIQAHEVRNLRIQHTSIAWCIHCFRVRGCLIDIVISVPWSERISLPIIWLGYPAGPGRASEASP